jgi:hypothetical protein
MSNKIYQVVSAMISRPDLIDDVYFGSGDDASPSELYFSYLHKFIWSLSKRDQHYTLFFYPTLDDSKEASRLHSYQFNDLPMQAYRTEEVADIHSVLDKLYALLNDKAFKIDSVFDTIIKSALPPKATERKADEK